MTTYEEKVKVMNDTYCVRSGTIDFLDLNI